MLIKEVVDPHILNKIDIKPDDPRYQMYRDTIEKYTDTSAIISNLLHQMYRGGTVPNAKNLNLEDIKMLDDIMYHHPIKSNIIVYHGTRESPFRLWFKYGIPLNKPVLAHFPSYISTSTDFNTAKTFTEFDPVLIPDNVNIIQYIRGSSTKIFIPDETDLKTITTKNILPFDNVLKIRVPKGTPGLSVESITFHPGEDEILLGRGLEIQINPYPTYINDGLIWDCKIKYINPTPEFFQESKI